MAPLPRLGKLLLALGVIGLIRLLPEVLQMGRFGRMYAGLVTMDAVLAFLTGAAGEGVWHGKGWAPKLVARTGGVVLSTSIGMSMFFAHLLIQNQSMDPFLLGRLLHFALCIALWPYALGFRRLAARTVPQGDEGELLPVVRPRPSAPGRRAGRLPVRGGVRAPSNRATA